MNHVDIAEKLSGLSNDELDQLARDLMRAVESRDRQIAELKRLLYEIAYNSAFTSEAAKRWLSDLENALAEQLPEVE